MKCRVCREPAVIDLRRHNANFCREHFLQHCRRPGAAGDRRRTTCSSPASGCSSPCRAARTRSRCGTSSLELGYEADGLYLGLGIGDYSDESGDVRRARSPTRAACTLHRGRPRRRLRLRHPRRRRGDAPGAVLRVRPVEAPPLRRGRARGRLRRRRHRPQPRRRGRGAVRQRAALGDRLPRPPAAGAARGARLPAQGQAARAPGRAGDGGVLRAAGHRLPGRGVPDGRRQPAPRVQGGAQRARGRARPGTKAAFFFGFLERGHDRFAADAGDERDELRRVHRRAARRRPARCARSAGCSRARRRSCPRRPARESARGAARSPPASGCCWSTPSSGATSSRSPTGGEFHTHAGVVAHDDAHRAAPRASTVRSTPARALVAVRPTLADFVLEDAARRAGHLSEGPRPDPDARRHLPRRPGARVRRRLGRAVDDAAARGGAEPSATSSARTSPTARRRQRRGLPRRRRPARRRGARRLRGHRRARPRPGRARPARAVAGGEARRGRRCAPAGSWSPTCPTITQVARCARRSAASAFGMAETLEVLQRTGTSRASRCGPTTGWWPTPGSSPTPACSFPGE